MSEKDNKNRIDIKKMSGSAREVLGAVVGLAKTCGNNPYTDDTIRLICDTLLELKVRCDVGGQTAEGGTDLAENCDEAGLIEQLHAEKYRISPGCAVCRSRCGNTDDYDIALILDEEPEKLQIKEELIYYAFELAKAVHNDSVGYSDDGYRLVLVGVLTVLSYDMSVKGLENVLEQAKRQL